MSVAEALGRDNLTDSFSTNRETRYNPFLSLRQSAAKQQSEASSDDASPLYRSDTALEAMFGTPQGLQRDFRFKGYTSQHMQSPRVPVVSPSPERQKNDDKYLTYYGKPSYFDPEDVDLEDPRYGKPRIDEGHRGFQYGAQDYDRGHPHPRPMQDPFRDRSNDDAGKIQQQKMDMEEDIRRMKEKQMREKAERDEEKRQNYELLTQQFPWDKNNRGHGAPRGSGSNRRRKFLETDFSPRNQPGYKSKPSKYKEYTVSKKRETDLFLDTLGGPGGTVMRTQDGSPSLTDPRYQQQQQQYLGNQYNDEEAQNRRIVQQRQKISELRNQIDSMKSETERASPYRPDFTSNRKDPQRSLDLEATRGGAGAPIKDETGRNVTRRQITLARNDYGESRIKEEIPGKSFDFDFLKEDNRPYYPWGKEGGGAPLRDKEGNVVTQVYGKLDGRRSTGSGEIRRQRRRQEVLYNELKQGEQQHKQSKEEFERFLKAPQTDVSDLLLAGRVGKPKRDAITGEIGPQHLGNSDVSKLKMNYQEKTASEKRMLHDELTRAAEERRHQRELEKRKEQQESNAHFRNMDSTWGAFGGGAPKHSSIRKKANLTNALYYPEAGPWNTTTVQAPVNPPTGLGSFEQSPIASYQKLYIDGDERRFPSPDHSQRYTKTTIPSSHKNMFESPGKGFVRGGNDVAPPYATNGVY